MRFLGKYPAITFVRDNIASKVTETLFGNSGKNTESGKILKL